MAGLSIRSLKVFDAVILHGTLGSAAEKLNMSHSAASRQLLELEQAVGLTLFKRTNRRLQPTDQGLRFYNETQHLLAGIRDIPAIVDKIKAQDSASLSIIAMPRLSLGMLAPIVKELKASSPALSVNCSVLRRYDIQRWAATKQFDVGLGMLPLQHRALREEPLLEVAAAALLPAGHHLENNDHVTIKQLADEPTIQYEPGLMIRQQIDDLCMEAGGNLKPIAEVSSSLLANQMAAEGVGIAITDIASAHRYVSQTQLSLVPIVPKRWWRVGLFFLKNTPVTPHIKHLQGATDAVVKTLIDDFGSQSIIRRIG